MLSKKQRIALLVEIHKYIEEYSNEAVASLMQGEEVIDVTYPPNGGLLKEEKFLVKGLLKTPEAESALRKIIADVTATCFFHFFCLIDAVGAPDNYEETWLPLKISQYSDNEPEEAFFHDDFFETYWEWRKRRPDPGWKLDNYEGDINKLTGC